MSTPLKRMHIPELLAFFALSAQAAIVGAVDLPARIEAEAFDAYFDTSAGNNGHAACNTGDVDAQFTKDTDGFCNIGWTATGEWTDYIVISPSDARYDLVLRAATARANARVHIEVDGVDVSGTLSIPKVGWQSYTDIIVPIEMTAGEHTVRVHHDNGGANLNYLEFITTWSAATADTDEDGVVDADDACPTTTAGQSVDATGCSAWQLDDDNDQVVNAKDTCPATVTGDAVDVFGCSFAQRDDDDDGINNQADQCSVTPIGETVDSNGCSQSQLDSDIDGISDSLDLCPGTAAGDSVDGNGCSFAQLDDDSDGVLNPADACPTTPSGETVDATGCSWSQSDDDGDGVHNPSDLCPGTGTGDSADSSGCSSAQLDDDDDGVNNQADLCPATPSGESVDAAGCTWSQLDDDSDGVNNGLDQCPGTTAGETVDTAGCSWSQRDDDGDDINNAMDQCPNTPSEETVHPDGCSASQIDDDNDGIANSNDQCPNSTSSTVTDYGCSSFGDEDFDHIENERDLCPFDSGLVELAGCQSVFNDFDGDGVIDSKDLCRFSVRSVVQPTADFQHAIDENGCSMVDRNGDEDSDGISDGVDRCPMSMQVAPPDGGIAAKAGISCFGYEAEDADQDGVINGLDRCEHEFGHKRFNGCPVGRDMAWDLHDLDRDWVPNEHDHCPFSPPATTLDNGETGPNGCWTDIRQEDHDLDGINNGQDLCPHSTPGHQVNHSGCTGLQMFQQNDNDNDGVKNVLDSCPEIASPEPTLMGCDLHWGDMDFDGLHDSVDECPNEPGLRLNQGCPANTLAMAEDPDRDGIRVQGDQCPFSQPVLHLFMISSNGCYGDDYADFDADGVINGHDFCPNTPASAFIDAQGCSDYDKLDADADGVMNGLDLCPMQSGTAIQNGCSMDRHDGDLDGTPNEFDRCPYTPRSSFVEDFETGCAADFAEDKDGDGVKNEWDSCPNSPIAVPVADNGCTFEQEAGKHDEDKDGVGDLLDLCPGTFPPESVDTQGCPSPISFDLDGDNVENDFDLCDDTIRASAINPEGCEIMTVPVVTQNLTRALPTEPPFITIGREDLVFAQNPLLDMAQPIEFEIGHFLLRNELLINSWGEAIDIDVPPHLHDRPIQIPLRVKLAFTGQMSNWFTLTIGTGGSAELGSLIVNDPAVLGQSNITLREVFRLMAGATGEPEAEIRLFRQFWDSQRSQSTLGLPFFCEWQFNGFPIVCDRPETDLVFLDNFQLAMEMDRYRLAAVVNRLDKHRNWEDCGEQRLVFGLQNPDGGRKFLNIEARLPNPMPGMIEGCRPLVAFWQELATLDEQNKSTAIFEFFYGGRFDLPAVISPEHFMANSGQIRSTQFIAGEWLFKEHKIEQLCGVTSPECQNFVRTVSVKENPFGELFNPQAPLHGLPWSQTAFEFQQTFPQNLSGLLTPNIADLENSVVDHFNHGQSHASGPDMVENDYLFHFAGQSDSPFGQDLVHATMGHQNADGSPLKVEQMLSRATALTCAGCHAPDAFGLTEPGRIGVLQMPNGERINAWPRSHDFVHINEFGELSPALQQVFLPVRQFQFQKMVQALQLQ